MVRSAMQGFVVEMLIYFDLLSGPGDIVIIIFHYKFYLYNKLTFRCKI